MKFAQKLKAPFLFEIHTKKRGFAASSKPALPKLKAAAAMMLTAVLCFSSILLGSCGKATDTTPITVIGMEGVDFVKSFVTQCPYRKAYSEQEKKAADLILEELKSKRYNPEVVKFGETGRESQNVILKIPGTGFTSEVSSASASGVQTVTTHKQVIVCAHYDTPIGIEDQAAFPHFDGIQGNASGVGALISIAVELKTRRNGYDVILVFFGAGSDLYAGSKAFFSGMTQDEIDNTDAVYCIDSIYAGDKLYAHAGINSIQTGKKYERRRKLYEISDVAIANSIDLRFNESDLDVDVNADGIPDVYREITLTQSDYSVFDNAGISCVFMESYDYYGSSLDLQMESKNPAFGVTLGAIRGTDADSLAGLKEILDEDRLETRIKNTAFLIVEGIAKGIYIAEPISVSGSAAVSAPSSETESSTDGASEESIS